MTTTRVDLAGIHVPLITPFESDGRIATDALEQLAHRVLSEGAVGLVALGLQRKPQHSPNRRE